MPSKPTPQFASVAGEWPPWCVCRSTLSVCSAEQLPATICRFHDNGWMTHSSPLCWNDVPGAPCPGEKLALRSSIPDGGAQLVSCGDSVKPYKVILLRSGDAVLAYVNRCAHFGVPLADKVEHLYAVPHESLRCSVHAARYRWSDGMCIRGECEGESLLKIPVCVTGDDVLIAPAA